MSLPMTRPGLPDAPPRVLRLGGRPLPVVGRAKVYLCGVTPYDVTHLGHAATYVWADVANRVLRSLGAEVEASRNITDVDDVLFAAAGRAGEPYEQFAAIQQFAFDRDMAALGVRRPMHEPRAHGYVRQVIELATALLAAGEAYQRGGTIYFPGTPVVARSGLDPDAAFRLAAEYGDHPEDPAKPVRTSRPGRARGGRDGPAGTPNARRWRCPRWGARSTCSAVAPTWPSRTRRSRSRSRRR